MSGSNRGADGGQAGTRGKRRLARPRPGVRGACSRPWPWRLAAGKTSRPAEQAPLCHGGGKPHALRASGFPYSCVLRCPEMATGMLGRSEPDPGNIARESRRVFPDPVHIARASRSTFPGSGLNRPGIAGEQHRLREQRPFHRGGGVRPGRAVAGTRFLRNADRQQGPIILIPILFLFV